jgi:phosphoribosylanthranilate isomerase
MTWIKICGITNVADGLLAASLGADAIGFIFAPSPRRIDPEAAQKIIQILPSFLFKVGVFVDEDGEKVQRIAEFCGLQGLQLHGKESPEYCRKFVFPVIKALQIKGVESLEGMEEYGDMPLLLDAYSPNQAGGTGKPFPWEIALKAKKKRDFVLSGGLSPINVGEAIRKVKPWGVDVCSGVESFAGRKDPSKMAEFVKEVKKADETAG